MKNDYEIVCFDMDGTLIRNTNSVEYLCLLSGKVNEVKEIEDMENRNEINWIEADYIKAELLKGLKLSKLEESFEKNVKVIDNLMLVLKELKKRNFQTILVTAGPIQVAEELNRHYGFDKVFGSNYEVINGQFTGKIIKHLGDSGKLESLVSFCKCTDTPLENVISIGDSESDVKIFEETGKSIAINYSNCLIGKANEYIKTEDLSNVLKLILDEE